MKNVYINPKYKPLFCFKTRYCIVIGGRGSGKSVAEAVNEVQKSFDEHKIVLFTRYTMKSAGISIIPEFWEKVTWLKLESAFRKTKDTIENVLSGSRIIFSGLKTSEGMQTAKLKSITGLSTWVVDEAEELVDESLFDTVDNSIRVKNVKNEVIIIMNPSNVEHFIYKKFYEPQGLPQEFNGVVDDVTYIHTTYLDNRENLSQSFIDTAERVKKLDLEKYNHVYLGHWAKMNEGQIFTDWCKCDFPDDVRWWYGVDFGFNAPCAIRRLGISEDNDRIYTHEVSHAKGMSNTNIANAIKQDMECKYSKLFELDTLLVWSEVRKIYVKKDGYTTVFPLSNYISSPQAIIELLNKYCPASVSPVMRQLEVITKWKVNVWCDQAEPDKISDLRTHGINAYGCPKPKIIDRINFVKEFQVFYTPESKNTHEEVKKYVWLQDRKEKYMDEPIADWDHGMDAIGYGVWGELAKNWALRKSQNEKK